MEHAAAGRRGPKRTGAPALPNEIVTALEDDPELAEAFHALTPGRQRSWALHVNGATQHATRIKRIAKARAGILAGRGHNEG